MTSLSYLLAYHLYGTINSSWCDTDDGSSFHLLGFSVLLWLFSFRVGRICLWILPKFYKTVLHKSLVWSKSLLLCTNTHTQLTGSPVPCVLSTVGPRQLFFLCWPQSAYSPGLDWRTNGRALLLVGPLTDVYTQTHRHGVHNVSLSPHSQTGHPVTPGSQWSKSCFRVCVLLQWDLVVLNFTPYELILCGRAAFPCLRLNV